MKNQKKKKVGRPETNKTLYVSYMGIKKKKKLDK